MSSTRVLALIIPASLLLACAAQRAEAPPPQQPQSQAPAPAAQPAPQVEQQASPQAEEPQVVEGAEAGEQPVDRDTPLAPAAGAFEGCAAPLKDAPPQPVTIAGRKATAAGHKLTFGEPDADGELVLGVLGPVNEDSPRNLAALAKYLEFFAAQKADAIVVSGDVGETQEGITRALDALAPAKLPVFVVAGNRECRDDFAQGVAEAQRRFDGIVNLNVVRAVELPGVTLVSLPGYHDPEYITCETGCRYTAANVDEVIQLARAAKPPVMLVSHGPPKGRSSQSLDYAFNAGNVGDREVNRAIREGSIAFGVFSNIKEAGARATDADGATQVAQDRPVRALFLNPGPADTTTWEMNDRTRSHGFAAVVAIKDGQARWKLFRAAKEKAPKAPKPAKPKKDKKK